MVTSECSKAAQKEDNICTFHLGRWSEKVEEELRNTKSLWLSAFYTRPMAILLKNKVQEWCAVVWLITPHVWPSPILKGSHVNIMYDQSVHARGISEFGKGHMLTWCYNLKMIIEPLNA